MLKIYQSSIIIQNSEVYTKWCKCHSLLKHGHVCIINIRKLKNVTSNSMIFIFHENSHFVQKYKTWTDTH